MQDFTSLGVMKIDEIVFNLKAPIAKIKFLMYEIDTLPEHYTQGKNFVFGPHRL